MNEVHILGNLARDPIIRSTKTGKQVASFTVAVNKNYTSRTGETYQRTSWINAVAWDYLAEAVSNKLKKGSRVIVDGEINTRSYDTPDGQRHWVTEVVASQISTSIVEPRSSSGSNSPYYGQNAGQSAPAYSGPATGYENPSQGQGQSAGFNQFGPAGPDPENPQPMEQGSVFPENGPQSSEEIPF